MIRVIGLGSPFGDDRAGWELTEALRGRVPAAVDLVALDRPGAALVNWMQGVDWLVLVDAYLAPAELGRFRHVDPGTLPSQGAAWSSHGLDLPATLALAGQLDSLPARLDLYAIAIDDPGAGERSAAVSAAVRDLAERLAAKLRPACRRTPANVAGQGPKQSATVGQGGKNSRP